MRTTTQHYSRPMPLLLLYCAPSFGCSLFFVYRGLCKNCSIDMRGRTHVIRKFIWTAATLLCAQLATRFFNAYFTLTLYVHVCSELLSILCACMPAYVLYVCMYVHMLCRSTIVKLDLMGRAIWLIHICSWWTRPTGWWTEVHFKTYPT